MKCLMKELVNESQTTRSEHITDPPWAGVQDVGGDGLSVGVALV